MEHASGTGKRRRNSATSWNHSSGQFAVSVDQLLSHIWSWRGVRVQGSKGCYCWWKCSLVLVCPSLWLIQTLVHTYPSADHTCLLLTDITARFPHRMSSLLIWIPETVWMSVNSVALFTGKALADGLKEEDQEWLLIVSSGIRNHKQSSGVSNSKGSK